MEGKTFGIGWGKQKENERIKARTLKQQGKTLDTGNGRRLEKNICIVTDGIQPRNTG